MLSVILPSYNEEKMIPIASERLAGILGGAGIDYELVFVDDGSRDATWSEIERCAKADGHIVGVHFSRNFGKEAAMFAGSSRASRRTAARRAASTNLPPTAFTAS